MITTVCLNPAFDRTIELDSFRLHEVNRARSVRTDAGGKGINVALVLMNLGAHARCLWCAPENGRDQMRTALDRFGLCHVPIEVPGTLRTNTIFVTPEGTTDLNESGAQMPEEQLEQVLSFCVAESRDSHFAVLTGSLPPGCPKGTYAELIRRLEVPAVLDVAGPELLLGLEAHPFLIKPNDEELEKTLGRPVKTREDVCMAARELQARGAQHVLVSLGAKGAMLFADRKVYSSEALPVTVRSTVGAGDAMLAGFLYGLEQSGDFRHAFACGVAAGSAAVSMEGTQPFAKVDFDRLLTQVRVEEGPEA